MPSLGLPKDQLRTARAELDQAFYNLASWSEAIHGTLVCGLPPDRRDIEPDAHRLSRFGQWCYGPASASLASHPCFAEIEREHARMHRLATHLLLAKMNGTPIPLRDYERFSGAVKQLRLEIAVLKNEIEDALYDLDALTGVPSRAGMLARLREEQEIAKRKVHNSCLAMMDLDHFKRVNDAFGHSVGDSVLASTARSAMAHLRPHDRIFRYGGEEFLLCLADASVQLAYDIIERLREELGSVRHDGHGGEAFRITVSFGLALLDAESRVEQSVERADQALYAAKARGRNRTVVWDVSLACSDAARSEGALVPA
jgi:diguanylate cyclase (GGDEF)-like protein